MSSFHRCGFASGRSRWLRRKILLLPIFQSLIDGADLPDGAEELFATSIALDGHLHAPTRNSAALKSVRLFDNHRLTRGIQRQLMTYIMALKNIETLACLGAQLVTCPRYSSYQFSSNHWRTFAPGNRMRSWRLSLGSLGSVEWFRILVAWAKLTKLLLKHGENMLWEWGSHLNPLLRWSTSWQCILGPLMLYMITGHMAQRIIRATVTGESINLWIHVRFKVFQSISKSYTVNLDLLW